MCASTFPQVLVRALNALEQDRCLYRAIGQDLVEAHLHMKRDEVRRLEGKSADEVRDYYLPFI